LYKINNMNTEQVQKAILEDREITTLNQLKEKILLISIPAFLVGEDITPIPDKTTQEQLDVIDKVILFRIEQIINFYNR